MELKKENILETLKTVIDPELGIDIVSLGFVYGVEIKGKTIKITMTLSSPGCPLAAYLFGQIESQIKSKFKGYEVEIDLTFDPPWSPERMSKEAKEKLGWQDEN